MAAGTILTIKHVCHEYSSSALITWAFTTLTGNFAIVINLVVFEYSKLYFLMLVLDFLGSCVILLLAFLSSTTESQYQVKGGLLLNIIVRQCTAIFKLLSSEDQTLLIWGDSLLILDFGLDIFNSI